jgi:hypothetical protein
MPFSWFPEPAGALSKLTVTGHSLPDAAAEQGAAQVSAFDCAQQLQKLMD